MSNEAESYATKEAAKDALLSALRAYLHAAAEFDMDDDAQCDEVQSVIDEVGKQWEVAPL